MKKHILLIVFALSLSYMSKGQSASTMPLTAGDTAVNTGTATKVLPTLTGGYSGIVIQPIVTKVSGTVAGTVVLYESLDGTNYHSTGDTMTCTNVTTNTTVLRKFAPVPVYYKLIETGVGTMSAILTIKYVMRKYQTY